MSETKVLGGSPPAVVARANADLAWAMPLHGHRLLARVLVASPCIALAVGVALVVLDGRSSGAGGAFLSYPLPGVGSLVQGRWLAGLALVLLGLLAWAAWIARGQAWAPPVAVSVGAWYAATRGAWWSVAAGVATAVALIVVLRAAVSAFRDRRTARFRALVSEHRSAAPSPIVAAVPPPPAAVGADATQEAFLRYFLDFGHRELDDWSAYSEAKEKTDSALRYQTVLSSWALYVSQQRLTPAFRQATVDALRLQAERGRAHRMWSYWEGENLRGAFRRGGDPFEIENVMYAGYMADVVSMYEAMSGDRRFDAPGAYSVTDGEHTYDWDHESIIERLAEQHGTSPLGGIPCQPGWMFPPCQTFSLRAMLLGDLVHGTDHGWVIERFLEAFRRYCYRDAHIDLARHNVFGITSPFSRLITLNGQAGTGAFLTPFAPDLTAEHYERGIRPYMSGPDADGRVTLRLNRLDMWDTSYGANAGLAYSTVLLYAREVGDDAMADGLQATLTDMFTTDGDRPAPGSVVSNALAFMAVVNGRGGLAAAHRRVPAAQGGVELAAAPYPQVVVTAASADADGNGLTAVVMPGPGANGPVDLVVSGLEPGRRYAVGGQSVVAGHDGRIAHRVDTTRRHDLRVRPEV